MTTSGFERVPSDERPDEQWRAVSVESWQLLGGQWWATLSYETTDGVETRTSLPISQIRPSDA